MCHQVADTCLFVFDSFPDRSETQEMSGEAVLKDPFYAKILP